MKKKIFAPKKITGLALILVLLLTILPITVFAEDSSDKPRVPWKYVTEFAVSAGEYLIENPKASNKLSSDGYWVIQHSENRTTVTDDVEFNYNAGGHYIYIGYKGVDTVVGNQDKLITGLLIYRNTSNARPEHFDYEGKTYYPVTTQYYKSNLNLNQGLSGLSLFLYYTTDDVDKGAPVLTEISADRSSSELTSSDYVSGVSKDAVGDIYLAHKCQDLNESVGGDFIYLKTKYHEHTLVEKYAEEGHYKECTECSLCTVYEPHDYVYHNLENQDGYHEGICSIDTCSSSVVEPHMDSDGDMYCDKCHAHCVAFADDIWFESLRGAWEYALEQDHVVTIYILETVDADKEGPLNAIDNGAKIQLSIADTADASSVINTYSSQPFTITNGVLSIETDIVVKSENFQHLASVSGPDSLVRIEKATIDIQSRKANDDCAVIYADSGARVATKEGEICIEDPELNATGILAKGSDTFLQLDKLSIFEADCAIKVSEAQDVKITDGFYAAKTCALMLDDGAKATATGGIFTGTECINAAEGNVIIDDIVVRGEFKSPSTIAGLLPRDSGAFILDDSEELYEGIPYSDLKTANYLFDKLVWISSCSNHKVSGEMKSISNEMHEGHCDYCNKAIAFPHEFDENGICIGCGVEFKFKLMSGKDEPKFYPSLKEALTAINGRNDVRIELLSDSVEKYFKVDGKNGSTLVDLGGHMLTVEKTNTGSSYIEFKDLDITFTDGTLYQVVRNAETAFDFENGTSFSVSNADMTLAKDCILKSSGGSFWIEKGGNLIVKDNATLNSIYGGIELRTDAGFIAEDDAVISIKHSIGPGNVDRSDLKIQISGNVQLTSTFRKSPINAPDEMVELSGGTFKGVKENGILYGLSAASHLSDMLKDGYWFYYDTKPLTKEEAEETVAYGPVIVKAHEDHKGYLENGVCTLCGYSCDHHSVKDGICTECGAEVGGSSNPVPHTGDDTSKNIMVYELMLAGSIVLLTVLVMYKRKKKR